MYKSILYSSIIIMMLYFNFAYGEPNIEYNSYKGIVYGFIIDYPSEWIVEESPYTFSYIKVSFIEPKIDDYNAFILVGVEELKEDTSLDEYEKLILNQQRRALQNFTVIETTESMLANNTGRMLIYKGIDVDMPIKGKIAFTIYNNTAYTIITSSKESEFDNYNKIFDTVISSLRLDSSIIPRFIENMYEDDEIKIRFDNWKGLISRVDEDTIIRLKQDIQANASMNIIITNITSIDLFNEQLKNLLYNDSCTLITSNFININGSNALEIMQECSNTITKSYLFTTTDKVIVIELITTKEEFNKYINELKRTVESIDAHLEDITIYLDEELKTLPKKLDNIDIDIPEDWNIFEKGYNNHEIIYITPNGSNIVINYTGFFITKPVLDLDDIVKSNNLGECRITTIYYITTMNVLEEEASCVNDNVKLHAIRLDNATIGYINNFDDRYGTILENFISNDLLFAIGRLSSQDLNYNEYKVTLNGTEYSVVYSYINSRIKNIEFDEDSKTLNVDISADDLGMFVIKESLLEEPYIIAINDDEIANVNNADVIIITYDDDTSIKIVGSRVVSEFPSMIILLVSLSLSAPLIINRYHKIF